MADTNTFNMVDQLFKVPISNTELLLNSQSYFGANMKNFSCSCSTSCEDQNNEYDEMKILHS